MRNIRPTESFFSLIFVLGMFVLAGAQLPLPETELVRLRHDWAMRFLEPGPHMELAKYFRANGNPIQAFYILENARRHRFETKVFDDAFLLHFGGFKPLDNSKAEEEKYLRLRKTAPDNVGVIIHLVDIYVSRNDFASAEPLFKLALEKDPENFTSVGALEEIYRRQNTPEKAKQILSAFESKYPTAAGSYGMRINRLLDSNPAGAKKMIAEALKKYPDDGTFWFYLAVLTDREKKINEAEGHFVKAAELAKKSAEIQARTASFFRVEKHDNETALKYYLNTYFLDPHAHFNGFAEAKVWNLSYDNSKAFVEKLIAGGKKAEQLIEDPNPIIAVTALSKIADNWDSSKTNIFIRMMRHDEVLVRWSAMRTLTEKEGRKLDTRVKDLLKDSDLRVRGLAAYMAVRLWKEDSFPEIRKMLREEAQLLRFDAVSALLMEGGHEGKKIVSEHKPKEPSEYLRKLIDASLTKIRREFRYTRLQPERF